MLAGVPGAITAAARVVAIAIALSVLVRAQAPAPPVRALVGVSIVNLAGGTPTTDAVVVIEGDRITAVGPASTTRVPDGADVIRAPGRWAVPGLINLHVHLGLALPGRQGADLANESEAALALRMAANARASLLSGVTAVRLTGESRHADFALRQSIERGEADGPRIFTAGQGVGVTGGHIAPRSTGLANDGPYEFRKAVRQEIFAGANWIKIAISGGISDTHGDIAAAHMTRDEMEAVIDTAHRHGVKVTAHSGSPVATTEAVELGVDCIEHGYFLTDAVLQKMKERGTWLVPTIVVSQPTVMEFFNRIGSPEWYLARVRAVGKEHWSMLQNAIRIGVKIALGTDQFPFEANDGTTATIREAQYYVEAGMTPLGALRAATLDAAMLLGAADTLGTIERGKMADIVLVDQDPTRDIKALRTIRMVMKGGRIYRNDLALSGKGSSEPPR